MPTLSAPPRSMTSHGHPSCPSAPRPQDDPRGPRDGHPQVRRAAPPRGGADVRGPHLVRAEERRIRGLSATRRPLRRRSDPLRLCVLEGYVDVWCVCPVPFPFPFLYPSGGQVGPPGPVPHPRAGAPAAVPDARGVLREGGGPAKGALLPRARASGGSSFFNNNTHVALGNDSARGWRR